MGMPPERREQRKSGAADTSVARRRSHVPQRRELVKYAAMVAIARRGRDVEYRSGKVWRGECEWSGSV